MRRSSWNLARIFLLVLLVVYGCLFVVLHRMELEGAPSGLLSVDMSNTQVVKRVSNPFAAAQAAAARSYKDLEEEGGETATADDTNVTAASLYPIPTDWENRIIEGRVEDYQTGNDLWDYTDLPSWMKGG
jgi:hypothetical protein